MAETILHQASPKAERTHSQEHILSKVDATVVVITLTAIFTALDFYVHPDGASNPEHRKLLTELMGPLGFIVKHIGNFGYGAAAAIFAVFAKHIGEFLAHSKKSKELVRQAYIIASADILAFGTAAEVFPNNNELVGDLSMFAVAIVLGTFGTEMALRKAKLAQAHDSSRSD